MTHTAELFTEITHKEYETLIKHPYGKWRTSKKGGKSTFHIGVYTDYGITDIKLCKVKVSVEYTVYYCLIIINLQRIIDREKSIKTYILESDFKLLQKNFESTVSDILPAYTDINKWLLIRIDYNIDLKMSQKEVEHYITLLQRGGKHYSWKIHRLRDSTKEQHPKGSVIFDNQQYSINIYNKYFERQCAQIRRGVTDEQELQDSYGILRIEVQSKNKRIRRIKEQFYNDIEGRPIEYFLKYEIAIPSIIKALKAIAVNGDYYSYRKALKIAREGIKRKDTLKSVGKFLESVSRYRSLWKAKKEYLRNGNKETSLETILKNLAKLNINPVTIPKSFGVKSMKNPIDLVINELENRYM